MQESNNRNMILAVILSIIVILGWQYFYVSPKMAVERKAKEIAAQAEKSKTAAGTADANGAADGALPGQVAAGTNTAEQATQGAGSISRDAAIAEGKRISIDTPRLSGSLNLAGARIDDLRLKDYHETVDNSSPTIILLSPAQMNDAFFAEFGFIASGLDVPGPATVWVQEGSGTLSVDKPVTLSWTNSKGLVFKRTISVDKNYLFSFKDEVKNDGAQAVSIAPYGRVTRFGEPKSAAVYVIHEGLVGVIGEHNLEEYKFKDMKDELAVNFDKADKGWVGITDKYWGASIIPGSAFTARYSYNKEGRPYYQSDYKGDAKSIAPGASISFDQRLFAGAKEVNVIAEYQDNNQIQDFDLMIDWGWFYFLTKPMFWVLDYFYKLIGNFGLAMMLVTICVKIIFLPLANMSYASMAKMKKLQPELEIIKERHGDDRMEQQKAMMELYRKEKINPAAGCWPMLVQIPVFFSIYKVLYVTIEMRHAPFFGWIHDLAAPDPTSLFNLFGLLPIHPIFGIMLGIWPIFMGITMFLQMRMNPTPPDPTQAMIFTWMPIVFTFMMASFPAGLVIYWTWNNTLSIIQQSIIMKRHGVKVELMDNLKSLFKRKPKSSSQ